MLSGQTPSAPPLELLQPGQAVGGTGADQLGQSIATVRVAHARQRPNRQNKTSHRRSAVARPRGMKVQAHRGREHTPERAVHPVTRVDELQGGNAERVYRELVMQPQYGRTQEDSTERLLQPRRVSDELQRYLNEEEAGIDSGATQKWWARTQEARSCTPSPRRHGLGGLHRSSSTPSPQHHGFELLQPSRESGPEDCADSPASARALSETDLADPASPRSGLRCSLSPDPVALSLSQLSPNAGQAAPSVLEPEAQISLTFNHLLAGGEGSPEEGRVVEDLEGDTGMSPARGPTPSVVNPLNEPPATRDDGIPECNPDQLCPGQQNLEHNSSGIWDGQGRANQATGALNPTEFFQREMDSMRGQLLDDNRLRELQSRIDAMRESGDPKWDVVASFSEVFFSQVVGSLQHARRESERLQQELDQEVLCQICFERRRDVVVLPCMHFQFCRQCLLESFKAPGNRKCPLCRVNVTGELNMNLLDSPSAPTRSG